jgi:hypothetical protein
MSTIMPLASIRRRRPAAHVIVRPFPRHASIRRSLSKKWVTMRRKPVIKLIEVLDRVFEIVQALDAEQCPNRARLSLTEAQQRRPPQHYQPSLSCFVNFGYIQFLVE